MAHGQEFRRPLLGHRPDLRLKVGPDRDCSLPDHFGRRRQERIVLYTDVFKVLQASKVYRYSSQMVMSDIQHFEINELSQEWR